MTIELTAEKSIDLMFGEGQDFEQTIAVPIPEIKKELAAMYKRAKDNQIKGFLRDFNKLCGTNVGVSGGPIAPRATLNMQGAENWELEWVIYGQRNASFPVPENFDWNAVKPEVIKLAKKHGGNFAGNGRENDEFVFDFEGNGPKEGMREIAADETMSTEAYGDVTIKYMPRQEAFYLTEEFRYRVTLTADDGYSEAELNKWLQVAKKTL